MYDSSSVPGPEFRVRTVVRHIVTRYCHPYRAKGITGDFDVPGSSAVVGEFHNEQQAYEVAQALAGQENSGATVSV